MGSLTTSPFCCGSDVFEHLDIFLKDELHGISMGFGILGVS
jgi:hypothetical protein